MSLLKLVWVGTAAGRWLANPKNPRVRGLCCALATTHTKATRPPVPRASGVKTSTAWTPPSRPGRKAHNCSLSGGTAGVSPARAEAHAEDARSALTRRSASSYLAPTPQPTTARPSAAAADRPQF